MNIYELLFIIQFLITIAIILVKFYNVMKLARFYNWIISVLLFVGFYIAYLVGFTIFMLNPERLIFVSLMNLQHLLVYLNWIFLIVEVIIYISNTVKRPVGAYNPRAESK